MVVLNQWNTLTVYRYRWDAWILLNNGQRILGRSKVRPSELQPQNKSLYGHTEMIKLLYYWTAEMGIEKE